MKHYDHTLEVSHEASEVDPQIVNIYCTNSIGLATAMYILTLINDEEAQSCTNSTGSATATYVLTLIIDEEV